MIPSILAKQIEKGLGDYIKTTFPMANEPFKGSVERMLAGQNAVNHEPFIAVKLPFRTTEKAEYPFESIPVSYTHLLVYSGDLGPVPPHIFLKIVEELVESPNHKQKLCILLTTNGGSVETVERYVNILRKHYSEIDFIVPDYAYSAGTVFCMSGDKIMMDYFSVLGPIDPQVPNKEGKFVAALGYLDKVNEFIQKAQNGTLTNAELIWMKEIDLGQLRQFEQARDLTSDLLKTWLVKYKFKNWDKHRNGNDVTLEEKTNRAEEIARQLSDNNKWKSHGRAIDIKELTDLKLKIDDYGTNDSLKNPIRDYYYTMTEFLRMKSQNLFIHTRTFF